MSTLLRTTSRRLSRSFALLASIALISPSTLACPVCDTDTGRQVRSGIFNADTARNAAATLLPFPILAGAVALLHCGPRRMKG